MCSRKAQQNLLSKQFDSITKPIDDSLHIQFKADILSLIHKYFHEDTIWCIVGGYPTYIMNRTISYNNINIFVLVEASHDFTVSKIQEFRSIKTPIQFCFVSRDVFHMTIQNLWPMMAISLLDLDICKCSIYYRSDRWYCCSFPDNGMKATTSEERIQKYARIKNQQYRQPGKSCDINLSCLTKPHLKFEPIYKDICEIKKYFAKETSSNLITMVKSSNLYGSFGEIKRFIMCINGKCVDGTWNYSQEMINDFREISRSLYLLHIKLTAIIHMVENPNEDLPNLDMTWSDQVLKVVHLAEESVEDLNNSIAELQPFSSEVKYYLEHNQIEKKGWNYRCELFFEAFDLQVE